MKDKNIGILKISRTILLDDHTTNSLVTIAYITVTCGVTPCLYLLGMQK